MIESCRCRSRSGSAVAFEWAASPGEVEALATVEATDPRASGDLVLGIGEVLVTEAAHLGSFSVPLTNADGAWTGTGRTYGASETQDVTIWERRDVRPLEADDGRPVGTRAPIGGSPVH